MKWNTGDIVRYRYIAMAEAALQLGENMDAIDESLSAKFDKCGMEIGRVHADARDMLGQECVHVQPRFDASKETTTTVVLKNVGNGRELPLTSR